MLTAPRLMLAMVGASLVVVAACSDRQEPTSPATPAAAQGRSISGATDVTTSGIRVPDAKPTDTDSVGFTKVAYVESSTYTVAPGARVQGFAFCPVGSVVVSGGVSISHGSGPLPGIMYSRMIVSGQESGWSMSVENPAGAIGSATFLVNARCVS